MLCNIGVLLFFPVILNVFVIILSYEFAGTLLVTTLMILSIIFLLLWDWPVLKMLIGLNPVSNTVKDMEQQHVWQITGLLIFSFTFLYQLLVQFYCNSILWLLVCFVIGLGGFIISRFYAKSK